ncbi:MAG: C_GCAxxG_C_C family protein [Clostridia bacterium]|nr:C_GCAxxG_C_C family protein [Clostridia bacterium]
MISEREKQAVRRFAEGCNCAQAVLTTYADVLGLTQEQAAMVSVGFGGGMGRLREHCGAFSAAVMLCGALEGPEGALKEHRPQTYARVQEVHRRFIQRNGTISCAELLGRARGPEAPVPDARTPEYYKSRPCARIIRSACKIIDEMLEEMQQEKTE